MKTNSRKQEERIAKELGGRRNAGSGNGVVHKNDVRTDTHSLELKYTDGKSYSLKLADLLQAEEHALLANKSFAWILTMGGRDWVIQAREDTEF